MLLSKLELLGCAVCRAQIEMYLSIIWSQLKRVLIVHDGILVQANHILGVRQMIVGGRVLLAQAHSFLEDAYRLTILTL